MRTPTPSLTIRVALGSSLILTTLFVAGNGSAAPPTTTEPPTTSTQPATTTTATTTTTSPTTSSTTTTSTTTTLPPTTTSTSVPARAPSAPQFVGAGVSVPGAIRVSWGTPASAGSSPITRYVVQRSVPGTSAWTTLSSTVPANTFMLNASGLLNGTKYYFRVAAVNGVGVSPWSASANATTYNVPSAPGRVTASAYSSGGLELYWANPTNKGGTTITTWVLQRSIPGTGLWTTIVPLHGYNRPAYVIGLKPGVRYYFRVAAVNAVGQGPWSLTGYGTPVGPPSAPLSVVAAARPGSAVLTWSPPATTYGREIYRYVVQRSVPGTNTWTTIEPYGRVDTRSYLATGLRPGVRYYFRIAAVTNVGQGAWSTTANAIPASIGLSVTLRASRSTARRGDLVTYTFTVANTSAWTTGVVSVQLRHPTGTSYVSYTSSGPYLGYVMPFPSIYLFSYSLSGIPPGATVTQSITVRVGDFASAPLTTRLSAVLQDAGSGPSTSNTVYLR